jgi:hypothetical protein
VVCLSREFESYNIGRNLYWSKFCLESGLESSLASYFQEISRSLANLDINIGSFNPTDAENIDEFLFDRLNEKEVALLSLGVAVGMIQSVLLSLSAQDDSVPPSTQAKMMGTIELSLQRINIVLDELGIMETEDGLVAHVQPLLTDFNKIKASSTLLVSEIQILENRIKMHFES